MPEGETTIAPEDEANECLHCVIVELVEERLADGTADIGMLTASIAESLVDVILRVQPQEQATLLAHTLAALGDLFLQKSGADGGGAGSTH